MGIAERKEREKEQRRKTIIDAAESVFFSKGFDNSSMDDVAKEAELSKGTLYLYFHSKEDLYAAIISRGAKIMNRLFTEAVSSEKCGLEKVRDIGEAFIKFFNEHSDYHDALMFDQAKYTDIECGCKNEEVALEIKQESNKILSEAIVEGMQDGSIRDDIDPIIMTMILWGQTMGMLQLVKNKGNLLNKVFNVSPEKLISEHMDMARRYLTK